jgi:hypothetical protein
MWIVEAMVMMASALMVVFITIVYSIRCVVVAGVAISIGLFMIVVMFVLFLELARRYPLSTRQSQPL